MTEKDLSFRGVLLSSLGAAVLTQPRRKRGAERLTAQKIPGRSGTLHVSEGSGIMDSILLTAEILLPEGMSEANRQAVAALLRGSGEVIFGSDPGWAYRATVTGALELEAILEGRDWDSFTVQFECDPWRYPVPAAADITLTAAGTVANPGTADAAPVYAVTGTGDAYLAVGSRLVGLSFGGSQSVIVLDADTQMAFNADRTARRDADVDGEIPLLAAQADTAIGWTGSIAEVVITPRWRYL